MFDRYVKIKSQVTVIQKNLIHQACEFVLFSKFFILSYFILYKGNRYGTTGAVQLNEWTTNTDQ